MMAEDLPIFSRRRILRGAGLTLVTAPLALIASGARAAGLTPKSDVGYQYSAKGDQQCGLCASFIPGPNPAAPGACQIVAGDIPPNGWCQLWTRKSPPNSTPHR